MSGLAVHGGSDLATPIPGIRLTATGLVIDRDDELAFDEYEGLAWMLGRLHDASRWAIGDLILYGEAATYGEQYAQAIEATGRSEGALLDYRWVAASVPARRRRPALSWTHHRLVASHSPDEQDEWLALAESEHLSVAELKGRIRQVPGSIREPTPPLDVGEILEVAREVLHASERGDDGYARVPLDSLDRLAEVLGEGPVS